MCIQLSLSDEDAVDSTASDSEDGERYEFFIRLEEGIAEL